MKTYVSTLMLMAVLTFTAAQADEVVLIVNPANTLSELTLKDVKKIYLGKNKFFPGGGRVIPADQPEKSTVREIFYAVMIDKSASKLKVYWSKRIFTGKGTPPIIKKGDEAMLAWVAEQPLALGYVYRNSVNDSVKMLNLK
ncbi:MAG: phosphate ABC transporter substrate-binding protein [Gammaproteobacteria bacterium]|nr:phosphate ABC transporter substrate-binding protein [Gammaproteobacteria bacterium]MCF6362992.1 phosphate ABC transporter substrate-binding protein [Gammaproteobacteria bacterium]